jgi:hypothetical protein
MGVDRATQARRTCKGGACRLVADHPLIAGALKSVYELGLHVSEPATAG